MTLRRINQLRFPLTKEGLVGLSQEVDALYREIQALDTALRSAASLSSGTLSPSVMPGLTGDVTAPVGSIVTTLGATGVAAGTYGDGLNVPQVTVDAKGRVTVAANVPVTPGPSSVFNETPGGAVNGVNTAYTTAAAFAAGSLRVYLNGVRLAETDVTPGASAFTLAVAPVTGDVLRVDYGQTGGSGLAAGTGITITGGVISVTNPSGLVLLEKHSAAGSALLAFTARNVGAQSGATFQTDYDEYLLEIVGMFPSVNGTALRMQMSTDGGASYDATAGHYSWASFAMAFNATGFNGSVSDTGISLINDMANAAKLSQTVTFRLSNMLSTTLYKLVAGGGNQTDSSRTTASLAMSMAAKFLVDATAATAFKIFPGSGTFTGEARLYGIAKS